MTAQNPILTKIQKLLRLADATRNTSEAEATAASLKVQELLQEHGLSLAQIEAAGGDTDEPKRTKQMLDRRAKYGYQVKLMRTLAVNNFCLHHVRTVQNDKPLYSGGRGLTSKSHLLVGRQINVDASIAMYDYLLETFTQLRADAGFTASVRDATNFMDGAVARVCERLDERRRTAERESKEKCLNAQGNGTGRELILADVYGSEDDLNNDLLNGFPAGTTATRRAENAARQAAHDAKWKELQAQGVEKWTAWYQAHGYGEDAAAIASKRFLGRSRRSGGRGYRGGHWTQGDERHAQKINSDSYKAGRGAGDRVGLDGQVGASTRKRLGS